MNRVLLYLSFIFIFYFLHFNFLATFRSHFHSNNLTYFIQSLFYMDFEAWLVLLTWNYGFPAILVSTCPLIIVPWQTLGHIILMEIKFINVSFRWILSIPAIYMYHEDNHQYWFNGWKSSASNLSRCHFVKYNCYTVNCYIFIFACFVDVRERE